MTGRRGGSLAVSKSSARKRTKTSTKNPVDNSKRERLKKRSTNSDGAVLFVIRRCSMPVWITRYFELSVTFGH